MDNVLIEYFNDKDINSNLQDIANKVKELILEHYTITYHDYIDCHDSNSGCCSNNYDNGWNIQDSLDELIDDAKLTSDSWYEIHLQKGNEVIFLRTGNNNWYDGNYHEFRREFKQNESELNISHNRKEEYLILDDRVFSIYENEDNYYFMLSMDFYAFDRFYSIDRINEEEARCRPLDLKLLIETMQEYYKNNLKIICGSLIYGYGINSNFKPCEKDNLNYPSNLELGYLSFKDTNFKMVTQKIGKVMDYPGWDTYIDLYDDCEFYIVKDVNSISYFKNKNYVPKDESIDLFKKIIYNELEPKNEEISKLKTEIQKDDVSYNALEKLIKEKDKEICDLKYGKNAVSTVNGFKPVDNIPVTRESTEYKHWVEAICKRDNSTCQICGEDSKPHVHHIYSYKDYPDLRVDMNNGIVLCKWHHNKYHEFYGYKNINPKTLLEFTIRELKR